MRGTTKNDIIHLNLDQKSIISMLEEKQSFVNRSHIKALCKQKCFQMSIRISRGFFQTI
jgi:hypothetical protein